MIFETVRDTLAEQFEIDPSEITMDTNLIDDIGADSLDVVELVMALEEKFGIEIPDSEAEKLLSIQDVVTFVENLNK